MKFCRRILIQSSAIGIAGSLSLLSALVRADDPSGLAVAVKTFEAAGVEPYYGASLSDLLNNDLSAGGEHCKLRVVEWRRRADVIREIELGQSRYADKATFAQPGRLIQPDVFIEGAVNTTDTTASWSIQAKDAISGELLAEDTGSVASDQALDVSEAIAKRLSEKLCKVRAGYRITGQMDDATITGVACGKLTKPFTATSPEVAGNWNFTPKGDSAGNFTYAAKNVGGVPGSGAGTYTVIHEGEGSVRLKLSGTGSIHSPVGKFSAPITESLTLTAIPSCERVGNR
ncbi:MAG TPA: hypothetical protein VN448_09900 [Gammaproteobacteria bacterium]|nr:hypothetical protein [Gammaproteobacteria bacterium]